MDQYILFEKISTDVDSILYRVRQKQSVLFLSARASPRDKSHILLFREARYHHSLVHPLISAFEAWYQTDQHLWVLTELVVTPQLRIVVEEDGPWPESAALLFASEIRRLLAFAHINNVVLGCLTPSQIATTSSGQIKVTRLSFARRPDVDEAEAPSRQLLLTSFPDAPRHCSPEVRNQGAPPSVSSDIYNLGSLVLYLLTGGSVYGAQDPHQANLSALTALREQHSISSDCCDFLARCLTDHPATRMSWPELASHPWLSTVIDSPPVMTHTSFSTWLSEHPFQQESPPPVLPLSPEVVEGRLITSVTIIPELTDAEPEAGAAHDDRVSRSPTAQSQPRRQENMASLTSVTVETQPLDQESSVSEFVASVHPISALPVPVVAQETPAESAGVSSRLQQVLQRVAFSPPSQPERSASVAPSQEPQTQTPVLIPVSRVPLSPRSPSRDVSPQQLAPSRIIAPATAASPVAPVAPIAPIAPVAPVAAASVMGTVPTVGRVQFAGSLRAPPTQNGLRTRPASAQTQSRPRRPVSSRGRPETEPQPTVPQAKLSQYALLAANALAAFLERLALGNPPPLAPAPDIPPPTVPPPALLDQLRQQVKQLPESGVTLSSLCLSLYKATTTDKGFAEQVAKEAQLLSQVIKQSGSCALAASYIVSSLADRIVAAGFGAEVFEALTTAIPVQQGDVVPLLDAAAELALQMARSDASLPAPQMQWLARQLKRFSVTSVGAARCLRRISIGAVRASNSALCGNLSSNLPAIPANGAGSLEDQEAIADGIAGAAAALALARGAARVRVPDVAVPVNSSFFRGRVAPGLHLLAVAHCAAVFFQASLRDERVDTLFQAIDRLAPAVARMGYRTVTEDSKRLPEALTSGEPEIAQLASFIASLLVSKTSSVDRGGLSVIQRIMRIQGEPDSLTVLAVAALRLASGFCVIRCMMEGCSAQSRFSSSSLASTIALARTCVCNVPAVLLQVPLRAALLLRDAKLAHSLVELAITTAVSAVDGEGVSAVLALALSSQAPTTCRSVAIRMAATFARRMTSRPPEGDWVQKERQVFVSSVLSGLNDYLKDNSSDTARAGAALLTASCGGELPLATIASLGDIVQSLQTTLFNHGAAVKDSVTEALDVIKSQIGKDDLTIIMSLVQEV